MITSNKKGETRMTNTTSSRTDEIVRKVQQSIDATEADIVSFINADWPEGDEHTAWGESASTDEIADWVIAGMR